MQYSTKYRTTRITTTMNRKTKREGKQKKTKLNKHDINTSTSTVRILLLCTYTNREDPNLSAIQSRLV